LNNKKRFIRCIAVFVLSLFILQSAGLAEVRADNDTDVSNATTETVVTATQEETATETETTSQNQISSSVVSSEEDSYEEYLGKYKDKPHPNDTIIIQAKDYVNAEGMEPEILKNFEGSEAAVKTDESGSIEWEVEVKNEGLYNIAVKYYPIEGKTTTIEREINIDGELPFEGARNFILQRIWKNEGEVKVDSNGNEYRPSQVEEPNWREVPISGTLDYTVGNYKFYFSQGKHRIKFISVKEPAVIEYIKLYQEEEIPSYEEVLKTYEENGYKEASADVGIIKIQGEDALYKSDSTLAPANDRSSPATEPYSVSDIKMNTIGGQNWDEAKQWIEWEVDVPEDGLYKLGFRALQNYNEGTYSSRKLYIDGKVPFKEAENISIKYNRYWQMVVPGGDNPYLFYLSKGKHILKLEVTLGDVSEVLTIVEDSVKELNNLYYHIMKITSASPDTNRDYDLTNQLKDLEDGKGIQGIFAEQAEQVKKAKEMLIEIAGSKGNDSMTMEELQIMLEGFAKNPEKVTKVLSTFRLQVSDLASWIQTATSLPLAIDYIVLVPPALDFPSADVGWYGRLVHEVKSFFVSFFQDYNMIQGDSESGEDRTVLLWLSSGRDPANVMKTLADNYFTPETGIRLDIRLVDSGILLPSVAAGMGPDVVISLPQNQPVDYALRGAVYDLTNFPDYQEVLERFSDGASTSFWVEDSLYALPETQTFSLMFYRKDILQDLGITEVPQTWEDMYAILPILQKNKLDIGLPSVMDDDSSGINAVFLMFLLQSNGQLYNDARTKSTIDSPEGIQAFQKWADLYTKYKMTLKMDELTRFRTGESPIVITNYDFYNRLYLTAPEIRGLWDFTLIPGTRQEDGTIRRDEGAGVTGASILSNAKDKEASWEFLKWWTSTETQVNYGLEIEGIQGPSARWATANVEAVEKLPWTSQAIKAIQEQRKWVQGVPEVPGGYMMGRNLDNAIREVINLGYSPRESLIDWNKFTNDEITIKRKEFGLRVEEE